MWPEPNPPCPRHPRVRFVDPSGDEGEEVADANPAQSYRGHHPPARGSPTSSSNRGSPPVSYFPPASGPSSSASSRAPPPSPFLQWSSTFLPGHPPPPTQDLPWMPPRPPVSPRPPGDSSRQGPLPRGSQSCSVSSVGVVDPGSEGRAGRQRMLRFLKFQQLPCRTNLSVREAQICVTPSILRWIRCVVNGSVRPGVGAGSEGSPHIKAADK